MLNKLQTPANDPAYVIVDVMGDIVAAASAKLTSGTPPAIDTAINYQYGYIKELNETLTQMGQVPETEALKFPLVWLAQPFTVVRTGFGWYGDINDMGLFIMYKSNDVMKAHERMTNIYKPILYKIYNELLLQITRSRAFDVGLVSKIQHKTTDRYFWGDSQQQTLSDIVDCIEISELKLKINNKC